VDFTQITPVTSDIDYSFDLAPACTVGNNSFRDNLPSNTPSCSLHIAVTANLLVNGSQSLQVLNNVSDSIAVITYESDVAFTYLGIPVSDTLSQRDYSAHTFGMSTQCKPISNECNLNAADGASTPFQCTPAFSGDVTEQTFYMTYFTDADMSSNSTEPGIENPYFFGIAALANPDGGGSLVQTGLTPIPEIVTPTHGGIAFVLLCSSKMYDIQYDSVNGSITQFIATPSNDSVANIWQGSMAYTSIGWPSLEQAASLATFSNSAQELADKIALAYSRVALAVGADVVVPSRASAAQQRNSFLVSRVQAAPLFTLVAANLLFVLLGVVLTIVALVAGNGEVHDVQARLSIVGLVADAFEGSRARRGVENMDDLFQETDEYGNIRIAIDRSTDGGYTYKRWIISE
jgi:hypothetical protein